MTCFYMRKLTCSDTTQRILIFVTLLLHWLFTAMNQNNRLLKGVYHCLKTTPSETPCKTQRPPLKNYLHLQSCSWTLHTFCCDTLYSRHWLLCVCVCESLMDTVFWPNMLVLPFCAPTESVVSAGYRRWCWTWAINKTHGCNTSRLPFESPEEGIHP